VHHPFVKDDLDILIAAEGLDNARILMGPSGRDLDGAFTHFAECKPAFPIGASTAMDLIIPLTSPGSTETHIQIRHGITVDIHHAPLH